MGCLHADACEGVQRESGSVAFPSLAYGGTTRVRCESDAAPVERVALLRPGAFTHSFDMNQRHVELAKVQSFLLPSGEHLTVAAAPEGGRIAPPGHYMLFALDKRRVPSEAAIVELH